MIKYYYTKDGITQIVPKPVKGCWVCMTSPTSEELNYIAGYYKMDDADDLSAAMDPEESSRIDVEDNYTLILVDIPTTEVRNEKNRYVTIPLGIILNDDAVITVCLEENAALDFFKEKKIAPGFTTEDKSRFLLHMLLHNAKNYLKYLRVIDKESEELEKRLNESTENPALIDMMELGKGLLYFTTSLKSLMSVLARLQRTPAIKKYGLDEELLEDVLIENKQALEMSEIYSGILNGMMDAYASIISNNMNVLQKFLAVATIVLSVPSLVFDAYGMNVNVNSIPFSNSRFAFPIVMCLAIALSLGAYFFFRNKKTY